MQVVHSKAEVLAWLQSVRAGNGTLGLVPTMGALHAGHMSLVAASVAENTHTVMSLFVNPAQFGPEEDLDNYPSDLEGDCRKAEAAGVDLVYAGTVDELYPTGYATYVIQEQLTDGLCGTDRPIHFRGMLTIVLKLFNIVRPDIAYFGQKDAQQAAVVTRMARDLDIGVTICVLPIVREPDGLAMSSRNAYLSPAERAAAAVLYQALQEAEAAVAGGMRSAGEITRRVRGRIESEPLAEVDYVELVDCDEISPLAELTGRGLLAVAARFGKARLIDNIVLRTP